MFSGPTKTTSYERFHKRIKDWKFLTKKFPRLRHYFWWIVHNCIAHMLIGLIPIKKFFEFHDYTSDKINGYQLNTSEVLERITEKYKNKKEENPLKYIMSHRNYVKDKRQNDYGT